MEKSEILYAHWREEAIGLMMAHGEQCCGLVFENLSGKL